MRKIPLPPSFETLDDVNNRRDLLLKRLDRAQTAEANRVATKLRKCRNKRRCQSAACPKCNRVFRIRLHREALRIAPRGYDIIRISLIPRDCRVEVGSLPAVDLRKWAKSRQRSLVRALPTGCLFYGGIDVSLNVFDNADPHWLLHLYGFVVAPRSLGLSGKYQRRLLRQSILKHCPTLVQPAGAEGRQRPLLVSAPWTWADFRENALYAHKTEIYRRSRYSETKQLTGKASTNVAQQRLDMQSAVELALWTDAYPMGTRLLLVGFRRHGQFASFTLSRTSATPVVTT